MSGAIAEVVRDNEAIITGTHSGATSATVLSSPSDFKSCGAVVGSLIKNTTDGSQGAIAALTENTVTVTLTGGSDNQWEAGDAFQIFRTATYNSLLSTQWTDKRYGHKAKRGELEDGFFKEDRDVDEDEDNVFGPGQPHRHYRG